MSDPINDGVRILVERIKSNPDEFCDMCGGLLPDGKWAQILKTLVNSSSFTAEERELVHNALCDLERERFAARVMERLFQEEFKVPQFGTSLGGRADALDPFRNNYASVNPAPQKDAGFTGPSQRWAAYGKHWQVVIAAPLLVAFVLGYFLIS